MDSPDLEKHANRHPVTGKLVGDFDLNPTQSDKGVLMTNLCPASRHPVHTFLDHLADKSSDTPGVRPLAPPLRFPAALISAFLSNQLKINRNLTNEREERPHGGDVSLV
ncbi:hypothetical protein Bbelb_432710 [Branchiostoma belcheri]|nr:hypothetical protein Bbelb_432710 [Branchiostoma belcheri]